MHPFWVYSVTMHYVIFVIVYILFNSPSQAEDIYQTPEEFIQESFSGNMPERTSIWIDDEMRMIINNIMDRATSMLKVNYWEQDNRTAWILEEIGKVKPITAGFVINNNHIERMKVLIYRESHGWEVKHNFFTDQFKGIALENNNKLTQPIDNISGATMSVDALRNLGKLALFLHNRRNSR